VVPHPDVLAPFMENGVICQGQSGLAVHPELHRSSVSAEKITKQSSESERLSRSGGGRYVLGLAAGQSHHHYARSPNLRRALGKMLDAQGSRPALPRRRLKSNLRRASHASQITKTQDAPHLRRVSTWLHTGFSGSQMQDAL
jgi:hypothetical protein